MFTAKNLLLAVLLVFISGSTASANYCSGDAKGCWLFREGSGTTVADSSGNSNTGNFLSSGHPAWESSSLPSRSYITYAADFDGATDSINLGNNAVIQNLGALSVVFWVYVKTYSAFGVVIGKTDAGINQGWSILTRSSKTEIDIYRGFGAGGVSGMQYGTGTNSIPTGGWHHVAFTQDGTTAAPSCYLDGSAIACLLTSAASGSLDADSPYTSYMGKDGTSNFALTRQTEIAVFNRVLSASEVSDIYNHGLVGTHVNTIQGGSILRGGSTLN